MPKLEKLMEISKELDLVYSVTPDYSRALDKGYSYEQAESMVYDGITKAENYIQEEIERLLADSAKG